jgi:hypothetical protein
MKRIVPVPAFGQRFGKLTVIIPCGRARKPGKRGYLTSALVVCDCGSPMKAVMLSHLGRLVNSCGCEWGKAKHGMSGTPEYAAWADAKQRCYNPYSQRFFTYGDRGIVMCEEWRNSFEQFYADMGPRPSSRHSLERKDNNKPYCPDNCEWALPPVQYRSRGTSMVVTYRGQRMTMTEAAKAAGIPPARALDRRRRGLPESEWFNTENKQGKATVFTTYQGERMTMAEAAKRSGIPVTRARARKSAGWPESEWFVPAKRRPNDWWKSAG